MAYLVIGCPHCGRARVWTDEAKSTKCPACGKGHSQSTAHVWGRFATQEDAREALGRVNAQKAGEPGAVERYAELRKDLDTAPTTPIARAVVGARRAGGQVGKAEAVAKGLTAEFGTWDEDQWLDAMDHLGMGPDLARALLDRLVEAAVIAQPRVGVYRTP